MRAALLPCPAQGFVLGLVLAAAPALGADYVGIAGGTFASVIANDASGGQTPVADFSLRSTPVTQGEFLAFVAAHPGWRRDRVPALLADPTYLAGWPAPDAIAPEHALRPVTQVSWFAAQAFCEAEDARLPTWSEWEYAAAADAMRRDARADPAWRARILAWYAQPASAAPAPVGGPPNAWGVRDLHGLVWEWVDDFNALLVDADSRSGNDPDKLKFCGAGAINLQQRENYAVLMRVALLSSLKASDSTGSLGFRCARPTLNQEQP